MFLKDPLVISNSNSMPKQLEHWNNNEKPMTMLQRAQFIERCTEWLVSECGDADTHVLSPSTVFVKDIPKITMHPNEFTYLERRAMRETSCLLCGMSTGGTIVANPFVQRALLSVCPDCNRGETSA